MPLAAGSRFGPYEILGPIGEGGMGVVYRARDPRLDRQVAIKLLPPGMAADREARGRLRFEAMAAAALDHPYICKIFEIGEHEDAVFLVMEYIVGETLTHRLRKSEISFSETLRLAGEIAEALQAAHAGGILHRDLKPSNIMLTQQGHIKIMDFGLAKRILDRPSADDATVDIVAPQFTAPGTILGTPDYMSPEQVKGQPRDVLALQDELASAIAAEINVQPTPSEQSRLASARIVNPEAHDAYLKGRYFFNRPSDET